MNAKGLAKLVVEMMAAQRANYREPGPATGAARVKAEDKVRAACNAILRQQLELFSTGE